MNKFRFTINALTVVLFTLTFASLAQAQATRTWVSGVGDDANPCSRTAPCKTFAGAISKTAAGGEIDALDPGGFGAVTITKAITIDGTGTLAGILSSLTNAIIVNAGANDSVNIRSVSIDGAGNGLNGIRFLAGKSLTVSDCVIFGVTTHGIDVNLTTAGTLFVKNTTIRNCGGDGISIITTAAAPNFAKAVLENSAFLSNGNGIHAKGQSRVSARNCDFAFNTSNGVFAESVTAGQFSVARIWASQISLNGSNGVQAGNAGNAGNSVIEIAQNQINNNTGSGALIATGGTINTFTNNSIQGNGTDGCGSCTGIGPGN
jgi:Right handed beta helix region